MLAEIRRIDPDYGAKIRTDLANRNLAPKIIDAIAVGLEKASLR